MDENTTGVPRSIALQTTLREVRLLLGVTHYYDVDFVNSLPRILLQLRRIFPDLDPANFVALGAYACRNTRSSL